MSVSLTPSVQLEFKRSSCPVLPCPALAYRLATDPVFSPCQLAGPLTTLVKQSLKVTNSNSQPVAFKVKTTAPKQYCVRPNSGRIEPGETVEVSGGSLFLGLGIARLYYKEEVRIKDSTALVGKRRRRDLEPMANQPSVHPPLPSHPADLSSATFPTVLLQPMKEDPAPNAKCRDKFLVQSVIITPEREGSPLTDLVRPFLLSLLSSKLTCTPYHVPVDGSRKRRQSDGRGEFDPRAEDPLCLLGRGHGRGRGDFESQ